MCASKIMKRESMGDLMEDLVEEILSRVPALSLARFRSTSKRWNALIKEKQFVKKHSTNAPKQSLVIMLIDFWVCLVSLDLSGVPRKIVPSANVTGTFSLKDGLSKEVDIRIFFHCKGLLLCKTMDSRLVVWNPCSGETRWIQPRTWYQDKDLYAFGYDNKSSCYKIFRRGFNLRTEFEVYDSNSNSWRDVGDKKDFLMPSGRGYHVNGTIYWLIFAFQDPHTVLLLGFDCSTDTFERHPLPPSTYNRIDNLYLSVSREEQQLFLLDPRGKKVSGVDVWRACKSESTGSISWTKLHRFHFKLGMTLLTGHPSNVLTCCNKPGSAFNILTIVGEDICIQVDLTTKLYETPLVLGYEPSLLQIHQGI